MNANATPDTPAHVPPELVQRFDFRHDPLMQIDPWKEFTKLNDAPDIFYSPDQGGYWAITRKSIVGEVLSQPELFSSAYNSIPRMEGDFRLIPPNLDPPEHTKYRKIITQRIFNSKAMEGIEANARTILRQMLDEIAPQGRCDFVAKIARPFPVAVFLKLMGMPSERLRDFSDTIEVFFRGETVEEVGAARMEVFKFAQDWLTSNTAADNAHILRQLKAAEVDGRPLADDELSIMVLTLFFAGLDTVTAQMAFSAHFLATHAGHLAQLVAEPAQIPNAVEELLRRFGIANLCRLVVEDTTLHGVALKKGDLVMVSSTMAGVDQESYPDPLEVDYGRPNVRRHLAFGKGIHRCAGERLARIELRVLFEEMLPRLLDFRLEDGAEIQFLPGTIMSMRGLPIIWRDGNPERELS